MDQNTNTQGAPASPAPASPQHSSSLHGSGAAPARQEAPGGTDASVFEGATRRDAASASQRAASLSPAEIHAQAEKIMANKDAHYFKGGPDHDYEVALVYRHHELNAQAAGEQGETMNVMTRLANRAITVGDLPLPEAQRDAVARDPKLLDDDVDLVNYLKWADTHNLPSGTMRQMLNSWANTLAKTGGVLTDSAIASLKQEFAGQLHPQDVALLEKWLRVEVAPNLARMRRGRR